MIISLYAFLLTLFYIYIAILVIKTRYQSKVALGYGTSKNLEQRIRAHSNFCEYVPLMLI